MKPIYFAPLISLLLLSSFGANAAGSRLRITCESGGAGAVVLVDGNPKGNCPLDVQVPAGTLKLRVQKIIDAEHEPQIFEQEIHISDGVVKNIEVNLGEAKLNETGRKLEEKLKKAQKIRQEARLSCPECLTEMVAIPGKNYEIGKHEITQAKWRAVMGNNPSKLTQCDDCPVEQVSWDDIQKFLAKINQKTGKKYRLPTEAEWEYACYGGSKTEFCGSNDADAVAWHIGNSDDYTRSVGQKQANGYGLYDMSGNVWEWTEDCGEGNCKKRVLRGGAWNIKSRYVRAETRYINDTDMRYDGYGFRLARTLP